MVAAVRAKNAGGAADPLREMSDAELDRHMGEFAARAGYEIHAVRAGASHGRVGPASDDGGHTE